MDSTSETLPKKKKLAKIKNTNKFGYYFILPFFLVFAAFNLYPTIYTLYLAFVDISGFNLEGNFIGLQNFSYLLTNNLFLQASYNTLLLWVVNFIPQIGLALLLAYWFTNYQLKLKGQGFFKSVFYFPNIITAASVAVIFFTLFDYPRGPINLILMEVGVLEAPFDFFRSAFATRSIVAFIQFWMWYGQTSIVLTAGILSIDKSLYEAAVIDGATAWQTFRRITLPLLKPITLYVLITSLVGGLQMFDIPRLLTDGGPNNSVETLMTYIFRQAIEGGRNVSIAAAASVYLLILTIILSAVIFFFIRDKSEREA